MADVEHRPTNFIRQIIDTDLASGKHSAVQTRFPPEPNGYLHIGHAKSICLNFGIAQDYQGKCNLRFDDTNPEKENVEFVNSISHDVNWLGFQWDGAIRYSSDYFDALYGYAVELINKGLAYVCFLNGEQMREYRGNLTQPGKNSPTRDTSPAENLALFEKMRAGGFKEGECSLRAKIDMTSSFMVMRDPVIYRVKFAHHHQTGDKWCIYPMYDFTHCISDALEGITHSLCTLEFQDNRRLYDWILDNITIPCHPQQIEFSRLNLEYQVMSKRKLHQLVEGNHVSGWDDPRMPTIVGIRRRGYTPESIRLFCERIGVSKADSWIDMSVLEQALRDDLDARAPRASAVLSPLKLVIENFDEGEIVRTKAIVQSMTPAERREPKLLNGSRRARIALGSGRKVSDVNNLVDRFSAAQKMMKQVRNGGMPAGMPPGMGMPALPKVSTPVAKKKKSKSGNPAKRAQEEGQ